jgi:hypothetical protein
MNDDRNMEKNRKLLILGPAFRRRKEECLMPAVERYDGLFYRVARKYLGDVKNVDVVVMKNDLTLIDGSAPLPYTEPEGVKWGVKTIPKKMVEKATKINERYLKNKLKSKKYSEVFISMGKVYARALPEIVTENTNVIFPTFGGPGPKAQALKEWLKKS